MKAGKQASKSLFVSALQSFLAPLSEAGPGRARGRCRGCDNGLHLAKLPVQAGWQHSSVTEAVNIVNITDPSLWWHCSWAKWSVMLDQPPSDHICDKLNQEHCDAETKAVSSLPIIEDSAPSNNTHFFEGVEKNLEVWFTSSNGDTDQSDLRLIPRYQFYCSY